MTKRRLNPKQVRFVEEYLIDLNASAAALRAGYKHPDIGRRLVTKSHVSEAIAEAQEERSKRTRIKADNVLVELARLAFSDVRKLFDEQGDLVPMRELDDDTAASIAGIEVTEIVSGGQGFLTRVKKVRRWDKPKALELLGKHLKMWTDKKEHSVPELEEIYARICGTTRGLPSRRLTPNGSEIDCTAF